jgi:hypothetical protein
MRFALLLASALLLVPPVSADVPILRSVLSEEEAVRKLADTILADNLYPWARQGDCLLLTVEFMTTTAVSVAVRERHEPPCRGDANTAPIIDRFAVGLKTRTISRYDITTDSWLPYVPSLTAPSSETTN